MIVYHLSAECFPVAKVGGLADVVGALPKYLTQQGVDARVVMPFYDKKFTQTHQFETVYDGWTALGPNWFNYQVLKEKEDKLGFQLYLIYSKGLLDREEVYSYADETEQFISYQLATLDWLEKTAQKPDVFHCHDHHTGLVPFLINHSTNFTSLAGIPVVSTVHNGNYHGWFTWDKYYYLPAVDFWKSGLLDWNNIINPLAASIKCCTQFTTVSENYLQELTWQSNGMEALFQAEMYKGSGIINGIDTLIWDPAIDEALTENYSVKTIGKKKNNKKALCDQFSLDEKKPLIAFIGRFATEKGADLLHDIIDRCMLEFGDDFSFLVLGSGDPVTENAMKHLQFQYPGKFNCMIGYNENLAHLIYAGSDFLLMPSRIEPCGLNQLYALRYGTMPIVSSTGGLIDTVIDFKEENGYGIRFKRDDIDTACHAVLRAVNLFNHSSKYEQLQKKMMQLDFSWDKAAQKYIDIYNQLTNK